MRTFIIAEAGVNHNGSVELAKKLIEVAANAGADAVKFQTFKTEKVVSRNAKKAAYQLKSTGTEDDSQFNMIKKLELSEAEHIQLQHHAAEHNILFLSTAFDESCLDFLETLNLPLIKVPSGEITNKPFLKHVASKKKPVILSTGMADMEEIKAALKILTQAGLTLSDITVLHCNTEYPTPMEDVNLFAMQTIAKELNVKAGYSDHTIGYEIPVAAVALGAAVIEKHFTLDNKMEGPDHAASLEPDGLNKMVAAIRNVEAALSADGRKVASRSEEKNKGIVRRSLHYVADLPAGHLLSENDLIALRPGTGISPMEIDTVIGKRLQSDVSAYELVNTNNLQ